MCFTELLIIYCIFFKLIPFRHHNDTINIISLNYCTSCKTCNLQSIWEIRWLNIIWSSIRMKTDLQSELSNSKNEFQYKDCLRRKIASLKIASQKWIDPNNRNKDKRFPPEINGPMEKKDKSYQVLLYFNLYDTFWLD